MKLNDSKTEFLIIVTRSTAEQGLHYFDKLSVGDSNIKPFLAARNLRPFFWKVGFQSNINNSCRAVSYHMYNSKRIRKYLSVDTTRTLIDAFIMGRVDYCDSDGGAGDAGAWGFSPPLF